jgi:O-acetyl-ADP-ribose deacetylase (regulator of RNase III)
MSEVVLEQSLNLSQVLKLIHGDLTQANVDAIVNAANAHLAHGGGVAGAIVRRGGRVIQEESDAWVREHGPITQESPAITCAGSLPCRFVIHAVGPRWGEGEEDAKLHSAVYHALAMADLHEFRSLALPAISTGIFGFPKERAARVIMDAILEYFREHGESSLEEVRIVLIDRSSVDVFYSEFQRRWPRTDQPR